MHSAVEHLPGVIRPLNLTFIEVSLKWLTYHPGLGKRGIMLSGSKLGHIGIDVVEIGKGPLERVVVKALNEMWLSGKDAAPYYCMAGYC